MMSWKPVLTLVFAAIAAAAIARPSSTGTMVCGGADAAEREWLASKVEDANLALEFLTAGTGATVEDVDVTLAPAGGGMPLLTAIADGPLCYVQLPPGRYRIDATFDGATRTARAEVPASAGTPVHVALAFPEPTTRQP